MAEWRHQVNVFTIEIEQIERQILGAERRRDAALRELNNHQRQIEQAEVAGLPARQVHQPRALPLPAAGNRRALPPDLRTRAAPPGRRSAPSTTSAATPPQIHPGEPGTTCTRACSPANGWNSRCGGWRRPTSTQLPRVRADQAHLAAPHFPLAFLQLKDQRALRDRDPRVDVRPRLPRPLHAPDQERDADNPVRRRPVHRRALPAHPAQQPHADRSPACRRRLSSAAIRRATHGCDPCCECEEPPAAMRPTPDDPRVGALLRARPRRSRPRAARTTAACSS